MRAEDGSLGTLVRRAVVRGAQLADKADSVWQQVAGEVVPAWQQPQALAASAIPPTFLDDSFAQRLLALPLIIGASVSGLTLSNLEAQLPAARKEAVLLYADGSPGVNPLLDEPFYTTTATASGTLGADGTALRGFPKEFESAAMDGDNMSNSTLFNFEVYVRWRVLQYALAGPDRTPAERKRLQSKFVDALGNALLDGPLSGSVAPTAPSAALRKDQDLQTAIAGCGALLQQMQRSGLFSRAVLQYGLGSGTSEFDEDDWRLGGSTSWQYIVSGSAIVGGSQLAQDRTAATGLGAGFYPGQLLTAPLAAYLKRLGIRTRIDEYFLDNRVGRPDPRTFSDPRYVRRKSRSVDVFLARRRIAFLRLLTPPCDLFSLFGCPIPSPVQYSETLLEIVALEDE